MDRELLNRFQGTPVKLIFRDGFVLIGEIIEVFDESILFQTRQGTSAIDSHEIKTIMPRKGSA